jgi:hypothetical protein
MFPQLTHEEQEYIADKMIQLTGARQAVSV